MIEQYAIKNNFNQISIVPTPSIYCKNHHDTLIYGLKLKHFTEIERYYSSIIPVELDTDNQMKSINRNKIANDFFKQFSEHNLEIIDPRYW